MINADFLTAVGASTNVTVKDQVQVPSNTTSGVGDAGTTARSTSAARRGKELRGPVWEGGMAVGVVVGLSLLGGVRVLAWG